MKNKSKCGADKVRYKEKGYRRISENKGKVKRAKFKNLPRPHDHEGGCPTSNTTRHIWNHKYDKSEKVKAHSQKQKCSGELSKLAKPSQNLSLSIQSASAFDKF